jgi:nitrile hydratase subunit beta
VRCDVEGVHDLGGRSGFGAIPIEDDEPVFHEAWEGRVWFLRREVVGVHTTTDRIRATIEQMPAAQYLASTYYERWLWAIERLAAEQGLLDSRDEPARVARPPARIPTWPGRFEVGDGVRAVDRVTSGHSRVPGYLRGRAGRVERVACAWPNPSQSAATGTYGEPELVYSVAFAATDLFGDTAAHTVVADLAESDLEDL